MREFDNILNSEETDPEKSGDFYKFSCEHCGSGYGDFTLHLTILKYGCIVLTGKKVGIFGFTCLSCLKTQFLRAKRPDFDKFVLAGIEKPTSKNREFTEALLLKKRLRYFSSVGPCPDMNPDLDLFHIATTSTILTDEDWQEQIDELFLNQYCEIPALETKYMCSYYQTLVKPMGAQFSISWFKEDEIEILSMYEHEHEHARKIFPRYFQDISLLENVDQFCWDYHMVDEYFEDEKNGLKRLIAKGKQIALLDGEKFNEPVKYDTDPKYLINLDHKKKQYETEIKTDSNDSVGALASAGYPIDPEYMDRLKQLEQPEDQYSLPAEFFRILVAAPKMELIGESSSSVLAHLFLKRNPYHNKKLPQIPGEIETDLLRPSNQYRWFSNTITELREKFHFGSVQGFLNESASEFIQEYVGVLDTPTFSFDHLWRIKLRYLEKLHRVYKTKAHTEVDISYAFYDRGEFFELIFNGSEPYYMKNRLGAKYLYYLVQHRREKVSLYDLDKISGVHPDTVQNIAPVYQDYDEGKRSSSGDTIKNYGKKPVDNLTNKRNIDEIKKQRSELEKELKEFESANDIPNIEIIKTRLDENKEIALQCYYKDGQEIPQRKKEFKNLRDRIWNRIKSEIKSIEREAVRKHFDASITYDKKDKTIIYEPIPDVIWQTD